MGELGCYITTITSKALSFVYHSSSSDCTMRTVVCFVDLGLLWPAGVCLSGGVKLHGGSFFSFHISLFFLRSSTFVARTVAMGACILQW